MKKLKPSYTSKKIFAELSQIRQAHKKALQGYRDQIYTTMQSAQKLIVMLENNDRLRRDFVKQLKPKKRNESQADQAQFRLSIEVAALAIGATSRKRRQEAWKHAEVLDYLRKKGVDVTRTAQTIKKSGGIANILKKIAAEKPNAKTAGGNTLSKIRHGEISGGARESYADREADEERVERGDAANQGRILLRSNNSDIKVVVWMRMSDRDEIAAQQAGTKFKLFGFRVGQKGGDFKITKIRRIPPIKPAADVSNDDWQQ